MCQTLCNGWDKMLRKTTNGSTYVNLISRSKGNNTGAYKCNNKSQSQINVKLNKHYGGEVLASYN